MNDSTSAPGGPIGPGENSAPLTLSGQWADYERNILDPINASQTQRQETRRAFYAGAQTLLYCICAGFSSTPGEANEADFTRMDLLNAELEMFNEKVKRGIA